MNWEIKPLRYNKHTSVYFITKFHFNDAFNGIKAANCVVIYPWKSRNVYIKIPPVTAD